MGRRIVPGEIRQQTNSIVSALEKDSEELRQTRTVIHQFVYSNSFQGKAWEGLKTQLSNHVTVIEGLISANGLSQEDNKQLAASCGHEVLDEDKLNKQIKIYEGIKQGCYRAIESYNNNLKDPSYAESMGSEASSLISGYYGMIKLMNYLIKRAQEKLAKIDEIEASVANLFIEARRVYSAAKRGTEYLEKSWTGTMFSPPANADTSWQSILNDAWDIEVQRPEIDYALQEGYIELNKDGKVTYDWDKVKDILNEDLGSITHDEYLALIQTYEYIIKSKNKEALAKFLSNCYVFTPMQEPEKPSGIGNSSNSYEYLDLMSKYRSGDWVNYQMSPAFIQMANIYTRNFVTDEMIAELCSGDLSLDEQNAIESKVLAGSILADVLKYGQVNKLVKVGSIMHKIEVDDLGKNAGTGFQLKFPYSGDVVRQHSYGDSLANVFNAVDDTKALLSSLMKSYGQFTQGQLDTDLYGLVTSIVVGCVGSPAAAITVKTASKALRVLINVSKTVSQNEKLGNAVAAFDIMEYGYALGIEGQMSVVNGKTEFQYLNLNEKTLAYHIGAYRKNKKTTTSVKDILTDPKTLLEFTTFCKDENKLITQYIAEYGSGDPTKVFSKEDWRAINTNELLK